jgi:hypothetical protein
MAITGQKNVEDEVREVEMRGLTEFTLLINLIQLTLSYDVHHLQALNAGRFTYSNARVVLFGSSSLA